MAAQKFISTRNEHSKAALHQRPIKIERYSDVAAHERPTCKFSTMFMPSA